MSSGRSSPHTFLAALATFAALLLVPAGAAALQAPVSTAPWAQMPIAPGTPVTTRPFPPKLGRRRCISVEGLAAAQLFGDRAIELSMKSGKRYRLFLGRECPALSFYQGFYYRRQRAGQFCAGRDVIGARSGGECEVASIIEVHDIGTRKKTKRKDKRRRR